MTVGRLFKNKVWYDRETDTVHDVTDTVHDVTDTVHDVITVTRHVRFIDTFYRMGPFNGRYSPTERRPF